MNPQEDMIIAWRPDSKNPCRQYVFKTNEELEKWRKRHPYKNEILMIRRYVGRLQVYARYLAPLSAPHAQFDEPPF